jgi:hypothetical protein
MAKKWKKAGDRQATVITPTTALFPIIPTEVFWELNPELQGFVENKPPQYFPNYYNYSYYSNLYKKTSTLGCAPRRLCVPRPCAPI